MDRNNAISLSILGADFGNIERLCQRLNTSEADWLHFDVMDGVFVDNMTFGCPILKAISRHCTLFNDVHLMMEYPHKYIEDFANCGADLITFHYESKSDPVDTITRIHSFGAKAGIAVKPRTPVSVLEKIVPLVDLILIMTVEPGFGGQSFLYESMYKIREARKLVEMNGFHAAIEVDGGINLESAKMAVRAGADILVSGSYVLNSPDMARAVNALGNAVPDQWY